MNETTTYGGTNHGQVANRLAELHNAGRSVRVIADIVENVLDMANDPTWAELHLDRNGEFWAEVLGQLENTIDDGTLT